MNPLNLLILENPLNPLNPLTPLEPSSRCSLFACRLPCGDSRRSQLVRMCAETIHASARTAMRSCAKRYDYTNVVLKILKSENLRVLPCVHLRRDRTRASVYK